MREASRRIRTAQPALSRTITELEDELGVPLFERVGRGVVPTSAGLRIAEDARAVLSEIDGLVQRARAFAGGGIGRIRIGSSPSATFHPLVPALLKEFRIRHPGVELDLVERGSSELVDAVRERNLDIAIVRQSVSPDAELATLSLAQERLVSVVSTSHPFAKLRSLPMARVLTEPLLLPPARSGSSLLRVVEDAARDLAVVLHVAATASHVASLVHLAAIGMGIALVPASVSAMRIRGVRAVGITSRARLPLVLLHRADTRLPSARAFAALARQRERSQHSGSAGALVAK
jgi:DNA-binding transcriptional LysR family regulator